MRIIRSFEHALAYFVKETHATRACVSFFRKQERSFHSRYITPVLQSLYREIQYPCNFPIECHAFE